MLFKTSEDFFDYTNTVARVSDDGKSELVKKMQEGDESAKEALTIAYLPVLASFLKRYSNEPSLDFIYRGIAVLTDALSDFNFQSESRPFTDFLKLRIKKMRTQFIADCDNNYKGRSS